MLPTLLSLVGDKTRPFWVAELWRVGYRALYNDVGEQGLVILVAPGITSVALKKVYLEKELGCRVVIMTREQPGFRRHENPEAIACCHQSLVKLWRMRVRRDNVVIVMVHAAVSHCGPEDIKKTLPGVRVISYAYDFMNLFVPPEQVGIWEEYHGNDRAKIEYHHLDRICKGEIADAVIYKDWGENWPYLEECRVPKRWIPQSVPSGLFFPPPKLEDVRHKFLYIGTIVPKRTHDRPSKLFADIMMEDIFREVTDQGFLVHAFVLNPDTDVMVEYQQSFPNRRVMLFPGDVLECLLPRTQGRYQWGWMMYHYPQPLILPFVNVSLPTKLWTYLALGIPPVVSEEMEAVARFVRRHKCGVVVSQEEIGRLHTVLDGQDYAELCRNVVTTRKKFAMERYLPVLAGLIRRVQKRPPILMEPYSAAIHQHIQGVNPRTPNPADLRSAAAFPRGMRPVRGPGFGEAGERELPTRWGRSECGDQEPSGGARSGDGHTGAGRALGAAKDPAQDLPPHAGSGDPGTSPAGGSE